MIMIRLSRPSDVPRLFDIWRDAVTATHDFLAAEDFEFISGMVRQSYLPEAVLHVVVDASDRPLAFMGLDGDKVDTLFVDPAHHGAGLGRALIETARARGIPLKVDVNEQNTRAIGFYERLGFRLAGRSETDSAGMPYPLLHLSEV
ncbi:acetyltransferase [Caulobacter sp. NIBR2454]|uniref:acetyltransferase n=1 Tax=Caulobacter sp. NIBR2454 TaxID=3015996 RepID=UPI0022B7460F|nr:acetyltransferase [Caulobacter sp. NIBR2454]